jgi:2-desacetyl-2-hydroxyethyl bacteriochlorophyllide A dehydrogenase
MKAIVCEEPGRLALVERPEPKMGEGEVLVRIRRAGVCGTDFHIFRGKQPFLTYPRVIGHELAGEVVEAPAGSALSPGETVAIIPYLSCMRCIACRHGKTNCCQSIRVLGVHIDGGLCDFLAVPERNVVLVGDLSVDQAAMIEFLAISAHGVRRAAPGTGDRVLVVGAGPIGMAAVIFAKSRGATVTALDVRADRLAFCREQLGADETVEAGAAAGDMLERITGRDFYDLVIDATGNPASMERGFGYVAHGGAYVFLGIVQGDLTFSDPEFHKRETTLLASRNATREDFEAVLAAIRAGRVPTAALNTHRASLEELPDLFPEWMAPEAGVVKALVEI